jgi:multicomponent K+:H+ antiporter subunit F
MYINVVALVILFGVRFGTELFFEAALLIALLGFVSTVALSRYLSRGDVIE